LISRLRRPSLKGVTRTPGWFVEATAWSAAFVLVSSVACVASGVVQKRVDRAHRSVVVSQADDAETPVIEVKGVKTAAPGKSVRPRASSSLPYNTASLGPPPGPVKELLPTRYAPPEKRYALVVGITNYRAPTHDTIAGANDAKFIKALLLANGWLPQNLRVLTDKTATGPAIRSGIAWLAAKSTPGTFTFFHYSGHVKQTGGHEKLWPVDRDFINDTTLASVLKRGKGKLWVDIAGCEAGGFIEDLPSSRVLVSASSKRTQKSYEYPRWGESVWSGLVFDLSLSQGQADLNADGTTTVGESLRYAQYWAQAITLHQRPHGRQTPQIKGDPVRGWTLANPPA
jgi:hypothetical protein